MRIPERCDCGGRAMVYCTIQSAGYSVRYRRCDSCGCTSKSIGLKKLLSSKDHVPSAETDAIIREPPFPKDEPC
jgi:hypothetical protein